MNDNFTYDRVNEEKIYTTESTRSCRVVWKKFVRFPIRVFRGGWESGQCEAISFVALQTCYILSFNLYIRFIWFPYLSGHFGDRISTGLLSVPVVRRLLPINLSKYIYLCHSICHFSLFLVFFLTLIRILFARSLKILRLSSLAIRFSHFLFHFTVLSDLYYSFAARASTSLPLCVTTLYWREQRDIRYLFLSFLCVISMPPAKIYAYPPRYISFAGYLSPFL